MSSQQSPGRVMALDPTGYVAGSARQCSWEKRRTVSFGSVEKDVNRALVGHRPTIHCLRYYTALGISQAEPRERRGDVPASDELRICDRRRDLTSSAESLLCERAKWNVRAATNSPTEPTAGGRLIRPLLVETTW